MKHNIFSLFILFFLPFNLTSMLAFPSIYESGDSTQFPPVLTFFGDKASKELQDATCRELVSHELVPNSQNTLLQTTEPTYSEKYSVSAPSALYINSKNEKFFAKTLNGNFHTQESIDLNGELQIDAAEFTLPSNCVPLEYGLILLSDRSIRQWNSENSSWQTKISSTFRVQDACIDGDGTVWGVTTGFYGEVKLVSSNGDEFVIEGFVYEETKSIAGEGNTILLSQSNVSGPILLYSFNTSTKTLTKRPDLPLGAAVDCAVANGKEFVGMIGFNANNVLENRIMQYNPTTDSWDILFNTERGDYPMRDFASVVVDGTIHFAAIHTNVSNNAEETVIKIYSPNLAPSPEFAIGDQSLRAGVVQKITLPTFSDPESTPVSYVVESDADWIVYNPADHSISATAPASAIDGTFSVTITATDADGISAGLKFNIRVSENLAPEAPAIADQSATAGIAYNFEIPTATDPEGDTPILISAIGLPSGLSVVNGFIQGTATESGTFAVTVMYIDAYGAYSETSFTLSVAENIAPEVPDFSVPNWYQGRADSTYTFPEGTDAEAQTLSYTLTGTLPQGLSFDANTRTLSGTATESGSFLLVYEVSDGYNTIEAAFTLVVEPNTGVGEPVEPEIVVYPNPATDKVFINGIKATSDVRIQLYDIMARTMQITYQRNGETIEISFSEIPAGTYFLRIRVGEGSSFHTIDIQKK